MKHLRCGMFVVMVLLAANLVTGTQAASDLAQNAVVGTLAELPAATGGVDVDRDGNIYVANFGDGRVIKVTPDGEVSEFVRVPGNNNGHITFDGEKFYVVGRGAGNIYTLTVDGKLELLAGTTRRGRVDGPALEAQFSLPNDLAISPDGHILYINEVAATTGSRNQPSVLRTIVLNLEQAEGEE